MDKDNSLLPSLLPTPGMEWTLDNYVEVDQTLFFSTIACHLQHYCILSSSEYDYYFVLQEIVKGMSPGRLYSALRKNGHDLPFAIVYNRRLPAADGINSYRWFIYSEVEKKLNDSYDFKIGENK